MLKGSRRSGSKKTCYWRRETTTTVGRIPISRRSERPKIPRYRSIKRVAAGRSKCVGNSSRRNQKHNFDHYGPPRANFDGNEWNITEIRNTADGSGFVISFGPRSCDNHHLQQNEQQFVSTYPVLAGNNKGINPPRGYSGGNGFSITEIRNTTDGSGFLISFGPKTCDNHQQQQNEQQFVSTYPILAVQNQGINSFSGTGSRRICFPAPRSAVDNCRRLRRQDKANRSGYLSRSASASRHRSFRTNSSMPPLQNQHAQDDLQHISTSLITVLSCEHGRIRREQRDITKRDLQKALKFGSRKPTWNGRWMIEYDGVIFITDQQCRREVTAYPAPLSFVPLERKAYDDHAKAKQVLLRKPQLCHSHYVIVIDNSGSMTTHDVIMHRDRQVAAYTMTALELIAEQLLHKTANNSDAVSLIEFSDKARVVFTREPISWVLFNKLLERRDRRSFHERKFAQQMEIQQCDSNYLPALDSALELLADVPNHDSCALSLLFLSDGAPSDARHYGMSTTADAIHHLCRKTAEMGLKFETRLNISMIGFGNRYQDFTALKAMVDATNEVTKKPIAKFVYCDRMANAIGVAISHLVTTTTETRTSLMERSNNCYKDSDGRIPTQRFVQSEYETKVHDDWQYYRILDQRVYKPKTNEFVPYPGIPRGALTGGEPSLLETAHRLEHLPHLLAVNRRYLGMGVERMAFRCVLANGTRGNRDFQFNVMVAKETKHVERIAENVTFHKIFCKMQSLADHLAAEFNEQLTKLPDFHAITTPVISFIDCSIIVLEDYTWPGGHRGVLVEKMLETEKYVWTKWNNNAGAVDGKVPHVPIDVDRELATLNRDALSVINEEAEIPVDDEITDSAVPHDCQQVESEKKVVGSTEETPEVESNDDIDKPSDYLQAFSHFTYLFTNKKVLVCDLQGVFNTNAVPPVFELSDPAIHCQSAGGQMVFGQTDKGAKGINLFFRTHTCSNICRRLRLNAKNKAWKILWGTRSELADQMEGMVSKRRMKPIVNAYERDSVQC